MSYIKRSRICWAALLVTLLLGCASTDKKKTDGAEALPAGDDMPLVLIPNPYVAGEVPAPAKREFATIKALMTEKKWAQAKGLLELMVETYPTLSGPYANLGIVHYQLKEYPEAEKALKFAIETNSLNFDAYAQLGLVLREQGRFKDAEATYLKALELWPHHLASAYNLGILYDLYMGQFQDALTYYTLSQKLIGDDDRQIKGWIIDLQRRMEEQ